jgi:hypothetical protein
MNPMNLISISDTFNLVLRLVLLFNMGVLSQLSLQKRFYPITVFLTGVWLTFFRLTLLRAIAAYTGIFRAEETNSLVATNIREALQSSVVANFSSLIVLAGTIMLTKWIATFYRDQKRKNRCPW